MKKIWDILTGVRAEMALVSVGLILIGIGQAFDAHRARIEALEKKMKHYESGLWFTDKQTGKKLFISPEQTDEYEVIVEEED